MRVWHPIAPALLDRARLLAEHRELHCIWTVLSTGKSGYRHHPETRRWAGHLPALARRHDALVAEMARRGWPSGRDHGTPVAPPAGPVVWPPPWEPLTTMIDKLMSKLCPDPSS